MQSYKVYKVSEMLKDRHPYVKEDNLMRNVIDPTEVAVAYNERAVPKLAEMLVLDNLAWDRRRDALITLNELVSHQESKVEMVDNKVVYSATNLFVDDNFEVRSEAAKLVGSLLFLEVGRAQFCSREGNYILLQSIIFDKYQSVRESAAWLLYRLSLHKDGVEMIVSSQTLVKMVEAVKYFGHASQIKENHNLTLYYLESFINISMYDFGITYMLGKDLVNVFNSILSEEEYSHYLTKGVYEQLQELTLCIVKNLTLVKEGKVEAISENMICTMVKYLDSDKEKERLFSSAFMTSIANCLEAKKQISNYKQGSHYTILEVTIDSLNIYRKFASSSKTKTMILKVMLYWLFASFLIFQSAF